jgi:hypothetical protein
MSNSNTGKWVGPGADTSAAAGGTYTYRTTFNLSGVNLNTVSINGAWATDNFGSDTGVAAGVGIMLNGQPIGSSSNQFQFDRFTSFRIPMGSPFQAGVNTLEFNVNNAGAGFTGLHVGAIEATAAPAAIPYAPITSLYNTGVGANHVALTPQLAPNAPVQDPHYNIVVAADPNFPAGNQAIVQQNHPAWLANSSASTWISTIPDGAANVAAGQYIFTTSFDLSGFIPSTALIDARFSADNVVDQIFLNDVQLPGVGGGSYDGWTPFKMTSGFVPGVNTLTVLFTNAGPGDNPGGFRLEMNGVAVRVPEPSSIVLCALGFAGLAAVYRRRRKA